MNKNNQRKLIEDRLARLSGKDFQKVIWQILKYKYLQLQTPKMVKDLGSDGHSLKDKVFFACYAPENNNYDSKKTIKKIKEDYEKFINTWKDDNNFKDWHFVVSRDLTRV